jgi:uncharacterized protein involved in exopolysaccharide biosynthesis
MSVDSVSEQPRGTQWPESDELDLTRYFGVLRRRWLEIVFITVAVIVLTAAGVLLYRQMTPPVYEANATAAIVRTSTDVRFDERFTTSSEQPNLDVNSRRAALVALVKSGSIAQQVIDELGDRLPLELRSPARLLGAVTAELATASGRAGTSDLIRISARAGSPELAATIANAWAEAYVPQVNSVYGQVPDDMLGSVETQLVEAQAAYAAAQASLEGYLATSQLDALTRQSGVISQTLSTLQQGKVDALNSYMDSLAGSYGRIVQTYVGAQADNQVLAFSKEQEGQRARIAAYLDAYNAAQVDTFTEQNNRFRAELRMYYDQLLRTNSLLVAARTLQEQVASGDTAAAGSALALQVLNLQMVNAAAATPPQPSTQYLTPGQLQTQQTTPLQGQQGQSQEQKRPLQIQLEQQPVQGTPLQIQLDGSNAAGTATSAADLRSQVDATVASLESQLAALEQNIAELNQSLLSGDSFQELNATVPEDSALAQAIAGAYPSLFQSGVFSATALQPYSSALFAAGQAQAAQFLALAENGTLPTASSPDAPMSATIAQLEEQLRTLQGQIEVERGRNLQFTQLRDLTWESVKALSNKQAELQLARAAANSEVRLSSLAVPLDEPVPQVSLIPSLALAAAFGLLLGIAVAFARELVGTHDAQVRQISGQV